MDNATGIILITKQSGVKIKICLETLELSMQEVEFELGLERLLTFLQAEMMKEMFG